MADYKAPDIKSLSAFDINKIQQSLNKFLATQGSYRDSPMYDPNQRGFRSQFEAAKRKAAEPRAEFKRGSSYGIEDEYRFLVSQGFRPKAMQIGGQTKDTTDTAAVEEQPKTGFTPTELDTGPDTTQQTQQTEGPNFEELFASQIASMQEMFTKSIQQQQEQYMQMQAAQEERMAALQQQMQQAMIAQQQRPTVAGVKMAEGTGGTPMQIARRGVTGAFGRRGMRISSLNV